MTFLSERRRSAADRAGSHHITRMTNRKNEITAKSSAQILRNRKIAQSLTRKWIAQSSSCGGLKLQPAKTTLGPGVALIER